jgi:hypothetical protein
MRCKRSKVPRKIKDSQNDKKAPKIFPTKAIVEEKQKQRGKLNYKCSSCQH